MLNPRILVVDDSPEVLRTCQAILGQIPGTAVTAEASARAAAERLSGSDFDMLITDVVMPGMGGRELVETAMRLDPGLTVIVLTGYPTLETAVACMKLGAADYVTKPIEPGRLLQIVSRLLEGRRLVRENALLSRHLERSDSPDELVGQGPAITELRRVIAKVAAAGVDVLVTGETGVGKELVARSIHKAGVRATRRFVPVDCGAIPEELMESELFGHERGAFTGADRTTMGLMEYADGGTVFFDELGELPAPLQAKLLRVLQERRFRRVGAREESELDLRVVAATNRDLESMVHDGRFREDLYYRINVARVDVPPLRRRLEDVPQLVEHFIERYSREIGVRPAAVDPDATAILARYSWPGNVRELQNLVRRALTMGEGVLGVDDLPDHVLGHDAAEPAAAPAGAFFALRAERVAAFERGYLDGLLAQSRGDVTAAARQADLPRGTFYRLIRKYGLVPEDYRA
jgi:DNA-binding NtrC family response regulator